MIRIISRGTIPKPKDNTDFRSNTFPAIVKLPSGRWIAGFKAAEIKGDCAFQHAVVTWSDDEGRSWSPPFEPLKLPSLNGVPGLSRILYFLPLGGKRVLLVCNWIDNADPSKPYYDPGDESLKDTRIFTSISEDDGETWSAPSLMEIPGVDAPVPLTGPPLMLADGTVICQFEINKAVGDTSEWVHKSAFVFSDDEGKTWKEPVYVTNVPGMYYWDQRPAVMRDGRTVVNFFWTLDGKKQEYVTIHASESPDGGRTWGALWDTGIYGQPGQPVDLGDGRLATIVIDRSSFPVITLRISRDHGRTFGESLVVYAKENAVQQDSRQVNMNEAWDEMARFSVGHPGLSDLGNNEVLAYYYAGDHTDLTSIDFVRIHIP